MDQTPAEWLNDVRHRQGHSARFNKSRKEIDDSITHPTASERIRRLLFAYDDAASNSMGADFLKIFRREFAEDDIAGVHRKNEAAFPLFIIGC